MVRRASLCPSTMQYHAFVHRFSRMRRDPFSTASDDYDHFTSSASLNGSYSATVNANGTGPFTWSISSGTLPAGMSLARARRIRSPSPVRRRALELHVHHEGHGFDRLRRDAIAVDHSHQPCDYHHVALAGRLPPEQPTRSSSRPAEERRRISGPWHRIGSACGPDAELTGLLSGTPSASGTFSVTVTDSESPAASVTKSFTPDGYRFRQRCANQRKLCISVQRIQCFRNGGPRRQLSCGWRRQH